MAKLGKGTWIVVADGEKALFLENTTNHAHPEFRVIRREDQPEVALPTDRPGRFADVGPGQRSAVEETDWHSLRRERFARDLAELLYGRAHRGRFRELVIVAEPNLLGDLRPELHPEVSSKVIAEIPKSLTSLPVDKLAAKIKAELDDARGWNG